MARIPGLALRPVRGLRIGTSKAGLKKGLEDVAVFVFDKPAPTAAVFTSNLFAAAPVEVAKEHLAAARSRSRVWLVNSGNANCGNGKHGLATAAGSCQAVADRLAAAPEHVLPFSTGVILERLSLPKLKAGSLQAIDRLAADNWPAAAKAIMTTDKYPKGASKQIRVGKRKITVTGIAKGAGMIHPDMATMLAFVATDAAVPARALRALLVQAVERSFNSISVDGDTSTNDAVVCAATGAEGELGARGLKSLGSALNELCSDMAHQIVADGEGATCVATVVAKGFANAQDCRRVADAVACSPLIKTMLHARDPNLGRLLMAIGKSGAAFKPAAIEIRINGKLAFRAGERVKTFSETKAQKEFAKQPLTLEIRASAKRTEATVHFSDLGHEYVKINADYRS